MFKVFETSDGKWLVINASKLLYCLEAINPDHTLLAFSEEMFYEVTMEIEDVLNYLNSGE